MQKNRSNTGFPLKTAGKGPLISFRSFVLTFFAITLLNILYLPASAFEVIPTRDYEFPDDSYFPEVLNVNVPIDCGDYTFRLTHWPLITKSMNELVGRYDLHYLVLRVGITNNSDRTIGWLAPESFGIREIYRNQYYGTYPFDPLMSAKAAKGYSAKAFYSPINPGETLITNLVFDIFPEAEGWVFTFSPHIFGEEPVETIEFKLPDVIFQ